MVWNHGRSEGSAYMQDERRRVHGLGYSALKLVRLRSAVEIAENLPDDVVKQVGLHDDGPAPLAPAKVLLRSAQVLVRHPAQAVKLDVIFRKVIG